MLLTIKSPSKLMMPITFSQKAIENMIETINMYGMSINKFKRTLRTILIENIYSNPYYFVHQVCLEQADSVDYASSEFDKKILEKYKGPLI